MSTLPSAGIVSVSASLRRADRAPDFFGGRWHVEMGDAEGCQRVDDGVHDGGECADIAGLARTLDTQWVGLGRHRVLVHLERAQLVGARKAIIDQRAGEQLTRALVIDEMLGEGLADALRHAAMDLALERALLTSARTRVKEFLAKHRPAQA